MFSRVKNWFSRTRDSAAERYSDSSIVSRVGLGLLSICLLIVIGLGVSWSREPATFFWKELEGKSDIATVPISPEIVGSVTTSTLIRVADTLLHKPGGYLSNDILPPGALLDNIPNWEYGVLVQVRDLSKVFRESWSRSQSQSIEDKDLIIAEPRFNFESESWILPSSESMYQEAIDKLNAYHVRLVDPNQPKAQFYARADNLEYWLAGVEKRLGNLSQRLSASVDKRRLNTDLAGEENAAQSTPVSKELVVKTSWFEIDDIFYEARGTTWALIHFLRAVEHDFAKVLEKKNAIVSVQQIIRELEATQASVNSPVILNGSGFGMLANHSLVMASYISRAHAAIIDLRELLKQG